MLGAGFSTGLKSERQAHCAEVLPLPYITTFRMRNRFDGFLLFFAFTSTPCSRVVVSMGKSTREFFLKVFGFLGVTMV